MTLSRAQTDHIRALQTRMDQLRTAHRTRHTGVRGLAPATQPTDPFPDVAGSDQEDLVAIASSVLDQDLAWAPVKAGSHTTLQDRLGHRWGRLTNRARVSLLQGERLREQLAEYYSETGDPNQDFALAVLGYSRALEIELNERLFYPFVAAPPMLELEPVGSRSAEESVRALRDFQTKGSPLSMGQMAYALKNLCGAPTAKGNGFERYLETRIPDFPGFCELKFSKRLTKFLMAYRNKAAHIAELSLTDCITARDYLLEEPGRLLITLVDFVPSPPPPEPRFP